MNAYIHKYIYLINIIKLSRINMLKINIYKKKRKKIFMKVT